MEYRETTHTIYTHLFFRKIIHICNYHFQPVILFPSLTQSWIIKARKIFSTFTQMTRLEKVSCVERALMLPGVNVNISFHNQFWRVQRLISREYCSSHGRSALHRLDRASFSLYLFIWFACFFFSFSSANSYCLGIFQLKFYFYNEN